MSSDTPKKLSSKKVENIIFCVCLFLFQVVMIILYSVWVRYDKDSNHDPLPNGESPVQEEVDNLYGYFRDVNIMIFFGFGFLMVFLRRYGYSSLGYTFLISAMVAQWSVLVWGFYDSMLEHKELREYYYFTMESLLNGLFCAGSVMISYGALLGKVTPLQMLFMGIVEPVLFFLNMYIMERLHAFDVGGGMTIHLFGAYYGLSVCWFLTNSKAKHSKENAASYSGDLFAMAGTLFLWMMWPSFNAAIAPRGHPQMRALANTFLSLTGSTIATFIVSRLFSHYGYKLDMVHVQNSTLAGGVVQGVMAHLNVNPGPAISMGFIIGSVSVLGYIFLTPFLARRFNIQDTCGIHNLHGMPGLVGSIAAVIAAAHAINNPDLYSAAEFKVLFPAGDDQAKRNAAMTFIALAVGIIGGIISGFCMKQIGKIGKLTKEEYFSDHAFWVVASDYPKEFEGVDPHQYIHDEENGVEMDQAEKRDESMPTTSDHQQ
ncbi:Rh-like protein/ammonium transporter [Heterostelium album PN500]|uniref:Rh-like protein/ammonium transporter n=1 Tax=Heterostelium pallidum (strain ATCC 26659 / Pp 5 / PN500) TaxID=670386 RepID=D3AXZ6_HETP5|nr:Rh-like protein/ammonium transporter [Heterostelium album PN500]EFA85823.1 Rh-like protein/ammonium transporter [Heterostelium album PN500]|eukprot:XP_020437929.1 Rh-like protein/ammonium transporter [Heterostelium album PN500]